ncbi:hypothetical protein DLM76_19790 [Leptospira yasudae]|uniref:GNAT family N-acetyltransferase n=1 Tax=Leptospira yasudae TaxID=2202201 RepID=UPI000E59F1CE|nr:GNAT family N-acetyltransferase [Leptospira yasudae]RHX91063.1 hypothetical protein DLM76_19790 [Leptospira yasudae]TGK26239.1 N-acetyltransferase [Leptospira yasudae]TGM08515.1 N-acetyltransferase [Leptospira yasudae]
MNNRDHSIRLEPSVLEDRRRFYDWLVHPELVPFLLGPPLFPDADIPTWEEFSADYLDYFFTGSNPELGRCYRILMDDVCIGQINYASDLPSPRVAELDIWMSSPEFCGHGYGVEAIRILSGILLNELGMEELVIRPSARNPRAVRAYEKAGFRRIEIDRETAAVSYGNGDYYDVVVLVLRKNP